MTTEAPRVADGLTRSAVTPSPWTVFVGAAALAVVSVVGATIAVASDLSPDLLDAMGPDGRLSVPLPMMGALVLLAGAAASGRRSVALAGSGLVAAAATLSVVSGVFDGGYADDRLGSGQRMFQGVLVATLVMVGVLAARQFLRVVRSGPAQT